MTADGFGDVVWFSAWLEAFQPEAEPVHVEVPGVTEPVILVADTVWILGLRCRFLRSPVNAHSPRWGFKLAETPTAEAVTRTLRRALRTSGCSGLELDLVAEGSQTHGLLLALAASGEWAVEVREAERTAIVDATADWEAYYKARQPRLRRHIAASERQLRKRGGFTLEDAARRDDWRQWFRRALELEAAGWKGREGTAILQHPEQVRFYEQVTEAAQAKRRLRLFTGAVGGRLIASRLDVVEEGVVSCLKTAYDESLAQLSPGSLVHRFGLQDCFADPTIHTVDLLGPVSSFKAAWATGQETLLMARLAPERSAVGWLLRAEPRTRGLRQQFSGLGRRAQKS